MCSSPWSHKELDTTELLTYTNKGDNNKDSRVVASEKAMAPYSSTLAWKITWTEEPGRLQSMGSRRVGHD